MKKRTGYGIKTRILAAALTGAVVFANAPAIALAADEGGSDPVTVETVTSDATAASTAVSAAQTAVSEVPKEDTTTVVIPAADLPTTPIPVETDPTETNPNENSTPEKSAADVSTWLDEAQTGISQAETSIQNVPADFEALQSRDSNGDPTGLLPAATASADGAEKAVDGLEQTFQPVVDADGKEVLVSQVDKDGKPVTDEKGQPVTVPQKKVIAKVPVVDGNGKPVVTSAKDENGNPVSVPVTNDVDYTVVVEGATTNADNAITAAGTARTADSESVANTAAQTAREELAGAEAGLTIAEDTVINAEKAVRNAQELYDQAAADADAAFKKLSKLQEELSTAQNAANAANERLKAAEKVAKALEQKVERNQTLISNIDSLWTTMRDNDDTKWWGNASSLCKYLLEYYITNGKLTVFDYENVDKDGNPTPVTYGSDFKVPVDFKVTLMTYAVPDPDNYTFDENGNLIPKATATEYILEVPKEGRNSWKDGKNLVEYSKDINTGKDHPDKEAKMNRAGIVETYQSTGNRIVVSFKDDKGVDRVFYFNYKENEDTAKNGSLVFYQKFYTKEYDEVSKVVTIDGRDVRCNYTNEIGIRWDNDHTVWCYEESQKKAVQNGQLTVVEGEFTGFRQNRTRYSNATEANGYFDYRNTDAMEKLSTEYAAAAKEYKEAYETAKTASAATQKLKDDIDALKKQYDPQIKEIAGVLDGLMGKLAKAKSDLDGAQNALTIATLERDALRDKVKEAREAVSTMNLSRFGSSTNSNGGNSSSKPSDAGKASTPKADQKAGQNAGGNDSSDNASSSTDAQAQAADGAGQDASAINTAAGQGVQTVDAGAVQGAAAADAGRGVRNTRGGAGRPAVLGANRPQNKQTVMTEENKDQREETIVKSTPDNGALTTIADPETPLAATFQSEEGPSLNLLWLLVVAAAVIVTIVAYEKHRKKNKDA